MTYTLVANSSNVTRDSDGAVIPADPLNTDYAAYLAWVAKGNTPTPAAIPPAPVHSCTLWQLQAVLTPAQWTAVLAAVAALNNPVITAFAQHGTNQIPGNSTTVIQIGAAIGLTPDQVLALVTQASTIALP
jgi:hypothetical protein